MDSTGARPAAPPVRRGLGASFEPDWTPPRFEVDWSSTAFASAASEQEADDFALRFAGQEAAAHSHAAEPANGPHASPRPDLDTAVSRARERGGEPLPNPVRGSLEAMFDEDLGSVRVHRDPGAQALSESLEARAFTAGDDVFFAPRLFDPASVTGRALLAHEVTHVVQGRRERGPGVVARVPAPPAAAAQKLADFDRNRARIQDLPPQVVARTQGGVTTIAPISLSPALSGGPNHLRWELYAPNDVLLASSSTAISDSDALSRSFVVNRTKLAKAGGMVQGRHLVRLIGMKDGVPVVYSDATFFLRTAATTASMNASDLRSIRSTPSAHTLGEVGAAIARGMMLEHRAAVASTGVGTVQGNQCTTPVPEGSSPKLSDCTTYVMDVLRAAFAAKGESKAFDAVMKEARAISGTALKGTALLQALVKKAKWKAVFWSPDPRNPDDNRSEHPVAYKQVKSSRKYYGVPVESDESVVDYRPTSPTKRESMSQLDALRQVPLSVIAARGGVHMTLLLSGEVYEVHWDLPVTNPNVIEVTPLERWGWNSGVVAMPEDDFKKFFKP